VRRILHQRVEVDQGVEPAAGANPVIDRFGAASCMRSIWRPVVGLSRSVVEDLWSKRNHGTFSARHCLNMCKA
jgi:hypothetical protein